MRLDHLIAVVPDIRTTHARLLGLGFEEAWPVGPFWPSALTSGVALGGANLELIEYDSGVTPTGTISTLVLAPASMEEGEAMIASTGRDLTVVPKYEGDPELLTMRGYPPEMAATPQLICTNLYPVDETTYPYFLCLYHPLLRARLAPENFGRPRGPLVGLSLLAPDPEAVRRLFAGRLGLIGLDVDLGEAPSDSGFVHADTSVAAIRFADGSALTAGDL